jgi:hypothetical protein
MFHLHSQLTPKAIRTPLPTISLPLLPVPRAAMCTLLAGHPLHTGTPQETADARTLDARSPPLQNP